MTKMLVFFKKKLVQYLPTDLNRKQTSKCLLATLLTLFSVYSASLVDQSLARILIAIRLSVELLLCLKCIKHPKSAYLDYAHGWAITSFIIILFTFEFAVVTKLKILFVENAILMSMISCAIIFLILSSDQIENNKRIDEPILIDYLYNNTLKPINVRKLSLSNCSFVLSLLFASLSLAYVSNLILTSVCYPKYFRKLILIPNDCSFVYLDNQNGAYQVGLFAIELSFVTFVVFVHRLLHLNFDQLKMIVMKELVSQSD